MGTSLFKYYSVKRSDVYWSWASLIPAFRKENQADLCEFQTSQGQITRPCLKQRRKRNKDTHCFFDIVLMPLGMDGIRQDAVVGVPEAYLKAL